MGRRAQPRRRGSAVGVCRCGRARELTPRRDCYDEHERNISVLSPSSHIRPQRVDLIRFEQLAPGRHGVLPLRYRGEEALALIAREFAQIGRALRIGNARAVAGSAVPCIRLGAALDLLRLERILRRCKLHKGEQRDGQDYRCAIQSGIRAKVQTDPPGSTLPSVSLFAEVPPPSPESTLTY